MDDALIEWRLRKDGKDRRIVIKIRCHYQSTSHALLMIGCVLNECLKLLQLQFLMKNPQD
uniref:Uncharacterized protein n=1 Tax=Onchocerca volvulus TaxID=6282 RepID=A0A8R1U1C1_ONCVO